MGKKEASKFLDQVLLWTVTFVTHLSLEEYMENGMSLDFGCYTFYHPRHYIFVI
jgi:hypothetical protein